MPKIKVVIQLIEMKVCMSLYSHKSMSDAKKKPGSFSIFGDMTSQNFTLNRRMSHQIQVFTAGKWV